MSEAKSTSVRKAAKPPGPSGEYAQSVDSEPMSLAEELADEAPLRADQAGRHSHRRAAADDDAAADRASPQGENLSEITGHQEAGPDLQDPQRAGEAQRADVRRGDAGDPARRLRLPAQPRLSLSLLPRRHLRFAQPDSPLRPADRRDGVRPDPPAQGKRAVLRAAARRGDQLSGSQPAGRERSSSTI